MPAARRRAVIYLLFGAASVEVSMENTPWREAASTAELLWVRRLEKRGLRVSVCLPVPKSPNSPGWSVQEPSTYREVRKNLGNEKIKLNAEVPGNGAGCRAEVRPCPRAGRVFRLVLRTEGWEEPVLPAGACSTSLAWSSTGFWRKCKSRL